MRAGTVARVYAETLLRRAVAEDALEAISESVEAFGEAMAGSSRVARFLEAPQIPGAAKRRALTSALEGRLHPVFLRFLALVTGKHREGLLSEIVSAWREVLDERAGRQSATVTTSLPLDDELRAGVREALERATGRTIVLEEKVDAGLLAGIVVRTGDTVIDGSVRTRLKALRKRLAAGARRGGMEAMRVSNEGSTT